MSPTNQAAERWEREVHLAELLAYAGRTPECVALLAKLLRVPSVTTVPMLRASPGRAPHGCLFTVGV